MNVSRGPSTSVIVINDWTFVKNKKVSVIIYTCLSLLFTLTGLNMSYDNSSVALLLFLINASQGHKVFLLLPILQIKVVVARKYKGIRDAFLKYSFSYSCL